MTEKHPTCPMCEAGNLTPVVYKDTFQHNGADLVVEGLKGYECPACGADPVFKDQIRRNHKRIIDAKRAADGLLVGRDVRAIRERLGLTQKEAAELFGGGPNAFSKYERGDVVQSVSMDRLLRIADRHPYVLDELRGPQYADFGHIRLTHDVLNSFAFKRYSVIIETNRRSEAEWMVRSSNDSQAASEFENIEEKLAA